MKPVTDVLCSAHHSNIHKICQSSTASPHACISAARRGIGSSSVSWSKTPCGPGSEVRTASGPRTGGTGWDCLGLETQAFQGFWVAVGLPWKRLGSGGGTLNLLILLGLTHWDRCGTAVSAVSGTAKRRKSDSAMDCLQPTKTTVSARPSSSIRLTLPSLCKLCWKVMSFASTPVAVMPPLPSSHGIRY